MTERIARLERRSEVTDIARRFRGPDRTRSLIQVAVTFTLFLSALYASIELADRDPYLPILIAPLSALLFLRVFAIQHDCGHHAFFKSHRANEILGFVCGVFTLMPHQYWWPGHSHHHRTANNLDRQTHPFPPFLLKSEFEALPRWKQRAFQITRNPYLLYLFAFPLGFSVYYRLPIEIKNQSITGILVFFLSNAISMSLLVGVGLLVGWQVLAIGYLPVLLLAGGIGMWLCIIQHVFAGTRWYHEAEWEHSLSSLHGASLLRLPRWAEWLLASANYHSLHHLAPSVPNYKLRQLAVAIDKVEPLKKVTLREALHSARLIIWDEQRKELVACPT